MSDRILIVNLVNSLSRLKTECVTYSRVCLNGGPLAGRMVTVTDRQTTIVVCESDIEYVYTRDCSGKWNHQCVVVDSKARPELRQ